MVRTRGLKNYSDVHFTRPDVAKLIVDHFHPTGMIMEPFRGNDAFFNVLPYGTEWCELSKGRDFFAWNQIVDWIVTNPPYSNLTDVMRHCFVWSRHTVLLVPMSKVYSSAPRMELVRRVAGLKEQLILGRGRGIGFNSGFVFAAMHFEWQYDGPTKTTWLDVEKPG